MFEHFPSVASEFSQPLLFTQKFTSMKVMLIFSHIFEETIRIFQENSLANSKTSKSENEILDLI
jgi:hypothetical protein